MEGNVILVILEYLIKCLQFHGLGLILSAVPDELLCTVDQNFTLKCHISCCCSVAKLCSTVAHSSEQDFCSPLFVANTLPQWAHFLVFVILAIIMG